MSIRIESTLSSILKILLYSNDLYALPTSTDFRVEAYDVAHLFGEAMVGVMTVIENNEPKKSDYRKFKITVTEKSNDTAALKEILGRRLCHSEWPLPDLIVVDGGVAQKNAALIILNQYKLDIPIVAVVKDKTHKPERLLGNNIIISQNKEAILLANTEAHRFAITYHRQKRGKRLQKKSP